MRQDMQKNVSITLYTHEILIIKKDNRGSMWSARHLGSAGIFCKDVALTMTQFIKLDYTLSFHVCHVYKYTKMELHFPIYVIH